jgi:hypothetical protein
VTEAPHDPRRLRREAQLLRLREALDATEEALAAREHAEWLAQRVAALEAALDETHVVWLRQRVAALEQELAAARAEAEGAHPALARRLERVLRRRGR